MMMMNVILIKSCSSGILPRPHREPLTSYTSAIDSGLDVNQLRSTINLLNTKLDSLESKIDAKAQSKPNLYPHLHTNIPVSSYAGPLLQPSNEVDGVDDLSSLSGLSDLSDLSDDIENDALDDEIDAIIKRSSARDIELKSNSSAVKSSIYKTGCKKKGRVEFDLSDLDLSDVEAAEVDSDSLDL
ncbi:hypothetical protein PoB_002502000 [Plakobranchus ocellatus]|uniref:Uncharacterized protein n=1 Tax=Plakobranchus ocellatus TaxID=259542 RepID=A0AAV3ZV75_9GAST|nr:hypothetical protein PoB_002502000 [Plakobranchus ocellatus]